MSIRVLNLILNQLQIWLNEFEKEQLYHELVAYFGFAGSLDECGALEKAWQDPYLRHEIEEFIKAWVRKRRRKEIASVV